MNRLDIINQLRVRSTDLLRESGGSGLISRALQPVRILVIPTDLVALLAGRNHVLLGRRATILPEDEVVYGQRDVVLAAVAAGVAVTAEHGP